MSPPLTPTATWPTLLAFLLASLVLAATPGPGVVYIVTRTLAQGRRAGLASVLGVALGNVGNAMAASLGLAALLALSSAAFSVVKFAGAAYLVYLGVMAWRRPRGAEAAVRFEVPRPRRIVRDGALVALLNPKTALFFAAFLPQFITTDGSAVLQSAGYGAAFVVIAASTDSAYVLAAGIVAPALSSAGRLRTVGRWATGAVYIGLGLITAWASPRGAT